MRAMAARFTIHFTIHFKIDYKNHTSLPKPQPILISANLPPTTRR